MVNLAPLFGVICFVVGLWTSAQAQQSKDYMAPASDNPGLVGGLRGITLIVDDLDAVSTLYGDGFGLVREGPVTATAIEIDAQRALWGLPDDFEWALYLFRRPSVPEAAVLRVLVVDESVPAMRNSWDRQEPGPYGIGFATADTFALDEKVRALGFDRTTPEVSDYTAERPDGTDYRIHEASWYGPGFIRAIAVSRKDGMAPVGPMEPATGMGGPSYSSQILVDLAPMLAFFKNVLDFEVRSLRDWSVFDPPFRFAMVHPKGPVQGHVAFVEYEEEHTFSATGVAPAPPHKGMAIWSFPTEDLDQVLKTARVENSEVLSDPVLTNLASFGCVRAASIYSPTGFLIELYERAPSEVCN